MSTYARPSFVIPTDGQSVLIGLLACSQIACSSLLTRCDDAGVELEDLTPFIVRSGRTGATQSVVHDSQAECQGSLTVQLQRKLAWGSDRIMYWHLMSSPEFAGGQIYAFPLGVYIPTTPGQDSIDRGDVWAVTGYDRIYLMQSLPSSSLAFDGGTTYLAAVTTTARKAGVLGGSAALSTIADYPGDWSTKTLDGPMNYPLGGGKSYVQIVNELLSASGQRPLFCSQYGRYQIATQSPLTGRSLLYSFAGGANPAQPGHFPKTKILLAPHHTSYSGDVHGAVNQWRFIQSGLSFEPIEGSGMYTVNNTTVPPTDQVTTDSIRTDVQTLDVSSTSGDLKTQGDKIVTDALTGYESLSLVTNPWPIAWQEDVFTYSHPNLPDSPSRRVVARKWEIPLDGEPMTWNVNAVASLA